MGTGKWVVGMTVPLQINQMDGHCEKWDILSGCSRWTCVGSLLSALSIGNKVTTSCLCTGLNKLKTSERCKL